MSDVLTIIISVIAFLVIFSVLILVHELGHFWAAKSSGVRVDEFGFGLPPRIWGKKKGDTLYSLNAIPFGGFVRLYGEDPNEFRATKAKDSFLTQNGWTKTKIVCGGVFMNFLLAWVLLTFGLLVGIEPMIVNYNQFESYLKEGHIHVSPYVVVENSLSEKNITRGDRVLEVNGLSTADIEDINSVIGEETDEIDVKVRLLKLEEEAALDGYEQFPASIDRVITLTRAEYDALEIQNLVRLPRLKVVSDSSFGLLAGDEILRLNEKEVLGRTEFFDLLYGDYIETLDVKRGDSLVTLPVDMAFTHTRIDRVLEGSPAAAVGLLKGDIIVSINGLNVYSPTQVRETTQRVAKQTDILEYVVTRDGEELTFEVEPDFKGLIGVALSPITRVSDVSFDMYETLLLTSILDVDKETAPLLKAPFRALEDIKDVGILTGQMIAGIFGNVFSSGEIPDGVSGPVGIAQMTHISVQNGFMDVVRFMAILSLSLGVLNILPFPALDGGRFAFILFESVTGKKVGHKFEAMIHAIGFAVLLLLIVLITWNDIQRLFGW